MGRTIGIAYVLLLPLLVTGCVTTAGMNFHESRVSRIEVNIMNYERFKNTDEMDRFEQEVIKNLAYKGYYAFSGPRVLNGLLTVWSAAEKLIPNSTADAFMIIDGGITRAALYQEGKIIGNTPWIIGSVYWMYNRNGERILQRSAVIRRRGERVYFEPGFVINDITSFITLNPEAGPFRILETEEEFRSRAAAEFTSNIPDAPSVTTNSAPMTAPPGDVPSRPNR